MIADPHIGGALVVGDALIDEIESVLGEAPDEIVGGAGLNVAVGLRRLGVPATLLAMVGDDDAGEAIRGYVATHTVALVPSPSAFGSSRATSTRNEAGEPTYLFNDAAKNREIDFTGASAQALHAASAIIVTCFPFDNRAQAGKLLDAVTASTAMYVVDPNARPSMIADKDTFVSEFEKHARAAWLVKISDDDSEYMYGTSARAAAAHLLELGVQVVLATYGADGAEAFTTQGSVKVPISPMDGAIVDTMGAGDATLATVVVDMLHGGFHQDLATWEQTLAHAMQNAAATCRAAGALLRTA